MPTPATGGSDRLARRVALGPTAAGRLVAAVTVLALSAGACSQPIPTVTRVQAAPVTPTPAPTPTAAPAPAVVRPAPAARRTPAPAPVRTPVPPDGFHVEEAMKHTRTLSVDIGFREAGTDGDRRAAEYVRATLAAAGLEATLQPFPLPQGGHSANVIGRPKDLAPGQRYLLLGGHMDSLRGPGANDNATGIAVMLEIVRALGTRRSPLPVVFVAFAAEENQPAPGNDDHHLGSRAYVAAMDEQAKRDLVAMINVDMVGRGPSLVVGRLRETVPETHTRLVSIARRLGVPVREVAMGDVSDHGTFIKAGMSAGWLWSGEDPVVHSPGDTFDRVQPASVERAGRVALEAARSYT